MEIKQKIELRHHLIPELSQSLNILALPLLEIKELVEKELEGNPLLEELRPAKDTLNSSALSSPAPFYREAKFLGADFDYRSSIIAKKVSLQEVLLRQLGLFEGQEVTTIIGTPMGFADGTIATRPTLGVFGDAGPEALIPLNQRGAEFVTGALGPLLPASDRRSEVKAGVTIGPNTFIDADPDRLARDIAWMWN